jgi:hypothetical protein
LQWEFAAVDCLTDGHGRRIKYDTQGTDDDDDDGCFRYDAVIYRTYSTPQSEIELKNSEAGFRIGRTCPFGKFVFRRSNELPHVPSLAMCSLIT